MKSERVTTILLGTAKALQWLGIVWAAVWVALAFAITGGRAPHILLCLAVAGSGIAAGVGWARILAGLAGHEWKWKNAFMSAERMTARSGEREPDVDDDS